MLRYTDYCRRFAAILPLDYHFDSLPRSLHASALRRNYSFLLSLVLVYTLGILATYDDYVIYSIDKFSLLVQLEVSSTPVLVIVNIFQPLHV